MKVRLRAVAVMGTADVVALLALHRVALRTVTGGLHGDVDGLSVDLAATGLFLAAAWLGVGLLAGVVAAAPGAVGVVGERLTRLVLPAVLRRVLAGSAGLGVLLAPVAAGAQATTTHAALPIAAHTLSSRSAVARPGTAQPVAVRPGTAQPVAAQPVAAQGPAGPSTPTPTPSPSLPPPTWPTTPSPTAPPGTPPTSTPTPSDTPAPTTPATPPSTPSTPTGSSNPSTARTTTVRAGDSLWMLAAHRLGTHASDADVDAYWREIYRQNRAVIGDDPNLIRPGQHLTLPAPSAKESTR